MIIGFGKTETDFENNLERQISDWISEQPELQDTHYFTDEFCEKVKNHVEAMALESREKAEEYKSSTAFPDRYTRWWVSVLFDASHIVFLVSFHHINRRHGFSPDGWAMLANKKAFWVEHYEIKKHRKAA